MFVVIHHQITDSRKWDEATAKIGPMVEQGQLPKGLKGLCYLPSMDGRKADCLWETDTLENLKSFLEPMIANAARNEYFQINVEHSFGLPVHATEQAAAR